MAWNDEEVQHRGQRGDEALLQLYMLPVLHHQEFLQSLFREERDVRKGDLHLRDLIQVRSHVRRAFLSCRLTTSVGCSRSNAYSSNACTSGWKAMLLNTVIVGRGHKLTASNTALTGPPAGFDSVGIYIR